MGRRKIEIEPITVSMRAWERLGHGVAAVVVVRGGGGPVLARFWRGLGIERLTGSWGRTEREEPGGNVFEGELSPIYNEKGLASSWLTDACPASAPLKRKNGLFKKAYELGTLCSVDIAVIVFGK